MNEPEQKVTLPKQPIPFSQIATQYEVTKRYSYESAIIHDIETLPEVASWLASLPTSGWHDNEAFVTAYNEVASQLENVDPVATRTVVAVSNDVFTLPVRDTTLGAYLADAPKTRELLSMVLRDVRAAAMKLAVVYDVAPPTFYTTTPHARTYYPTPSFPSLTTAETAAVMYTLAAIHPEAAQFYAEALTAYLKNVWKSGAHFSRDIEAAVTLVGFFEKAARVHPGYASYRENASKEWVTVTAPPTATTSEWYYLPDFPAPGGYRLLYRKIDPTVSFAEKSLEGSIGLTLLDTRLPQPVTRAYQFDLKSQTLLPFMVDLTPRLSSLLKDNVSLLQRGSFGSTWVVTGELPSRHEWSLPLYKQELLRRDGDDIVRVLNSGTTFITSLALSPSETRIAITQSSSPTHDQAESLVRVLDTDQSWGGHSPHFVSEQTLLYATNRGLAVASLVTGDVDEVGVTSTVDVLGYAHDAELVLMGTNDTTNQERPQVDFTIAALQEEQGRYALTTIAEARLENAVVKDVVLSPGGRYAALVVAESWAQIATKLLIFDILNGIIVNEVTLRDYDPRFVSLDEWVD